MKRAATPPPVHDSKRPAVAPIPGGSAALDADDIFEDDVSSVASSGLFSSADEISEEGTENHHSAVVDAPVDSEVSAVLATVPDNNAVFNGEDTFDDDPLSVASSGLFSSADEGSEEESESETAAGQVVSEEYNCAVVYPPVLSKKRVGKNQELTPLVSEGQLLYIRHADEQFYLRYLFQDKLVVQTFKLPECKVIPKQFMLSGECYRLVCSKFEKRDNKTPIMFKMDSDHGAQGYIKAFYVSQYTEKEIAEKLCETADFTTLTASKAVSRLELLVSPAQVDSKRNPRVWHWKDSELEMIPDFHHLGCGFAPLSMFSKLFPEVPETSCCQVRIVSPSLGILKGMLMAHPHITNIQCPQSMLKVPPSIITPTGGTKKKAYILVNGVFPSKSSKLMGRWLHPKLPDPPKSSEKDLRPLSEMIQKLFVTSGVPPALVESYVQESKFWQRRTWYFCVGVSDPTGSIPEDHVFVSGMGVGYQSDTKMFVTRCPCTEARDGRVLQAVTSKPAAMSPEEWDFLKSLHFGVIIFPFPQSPHKKALPPQIANGDLDGDQYFVCWDREIVDYILPYEEGAIISVHDSVEEEEVVDPLLGQKVSKKIDGKTIHGVTVKLAESSDPDEEKEYICDFGKYGQFAMTVEEILGGRDFMQKILEHKPSACGPEVLILWQMSQTQTWQRVDVLRREDDTNASELAEYARQHNLLDTKGWEWASEYQRLKQIVEIYHHKGKSLSTLKVKVKYDDGDFEWEKAEDLLDEDDHKKVLVDYARKQELLDDEAWKFAKEALCDKHTWFTAVQDIVSDAERYSGYSRLTENLHKAWKDSCLKGQDDVEDTVALGRAFKDSLDICKHGGMVRLPFKLSLRLNKSARKHIQYTYE